MAGINRLISTNPILKNIFDSISSGVLLIDENRTVKTLNSALAKNLGVLKKTATGLRLGELIGCIYAQENLNEEKETSLAYCGHCEIRKATEKALVKNRKYHTRANIQVNSDGEIHDVSFTIKSFPLSHQGHRYALLIFENASRLYALHKTSGTPGGAEGIIGKNNVIRELRELIHEVSQYDFPVLIEGESGTGKELVAKAIHVESARADKLFVPVNCAALPHGLLESELFGHRKGAFTGAIRDKKGRFELAHGGSIFLDEIGDLDLSLQSKLLRVLQEGSFERVGSSQTFNIDVRVISATNKDLREEVETSQFRLDLYYRLCVVHLKIPPLRERLDDVPVLFKHFLKMAGHKKTSFSREVMDILMKHDWPGNVRELQNTIQFSLMKCKGKTIQIDHLPAYFQEKRKPEPLPKTRKRKLTRKAVIKALEKNHGNKLRAARELDVSRSTLYRFINDKMKDDGLIYSFSEK